MLCCLQSIASRIYVGSAQILREKERKLKNTHAALDREGGARQCYLRFVIEAAREKKTKQGGD